MRLAAYFYLRSVEIFAWLTPTCPAFVCKMVRQWVRCCLPFQSMQSRLREALEGQGQAAEVQQGFRKLQAEHRASVAALAALEAAHAEAEACHSAQLLTLEKQLQSARAEAADLRSQLSAAQRASASSKAASLAAAGGSETGGGASMQAVSEIERELQSALKAQAALQLAKEGAERELASVRGELTALQEKQRSVQDAATVGREINPQDAGPVSAASGAGVMPELAAAKAAAAEATKQVEVLGGKLASAQVLFFALALHEANVASQPSSISWCCTACFAQNAL